MKDGDLLRELAYRPCDVNTLPDEGREAAICRHPLHHQDAVAILATPIHEVEHLEVDVRGHPAVECELPATGHIAPSRGAEVEETEVDRLLDLVGVVTAQQHHGGVGLSHFRARDRALVGTRRGPRLRLQIAVYCR